MIGRILFKMANGKFMGRVVGLGIKYFNFVLPVKKVYNSNNVFGFFHPKPFIKGHILLVPKKYIQNLFEIGKAKNRPLFIDIYHSANKVVKQQGKENSTYIICANGGKRQEVQQVHFHLLKDYEIANEFDINMSNEIFYNNDYIEVIQHPNPNWEVQLAIRALYHLKNLRLSGVKQTHAYFSKVPGVKRYHLKELYDSIRQETSL